MTYIKRHAEKTLERFAAEFPSVLITGARQTGKTTLLKKFAGARGIKSSTFDDPSEEISATEDPKSYLEFHPSPYMFDEVQYVPNFFRYIKMRIDADRMNGMYFFTGSQQLSLVQNASESLAGRVGILQMYPLSQREIRVDSFDAPFVPCRDYIFDRNRSLSDLKYSSEETWRRIFFGGYPELLVSKISANDFFSSYIKTYIERDIRKVSKIEDEMQFIQFITVVAARTGQLVNYADISRDVGISEITAKKWLSLLVTSGLVYLLRPYSANIEKRVVKTPKLYFMDTGLAAALTKWTSPEILRNGAMAGNFFESFVVGEIVKSFSNMAIEPPLYFYRDKDKYEIDLLIAIDGKLYPVEIKKTATPSAADARNFFVTSRIKGVDVQNPVIVCNTSSAVSVKKDTFAIPVEWI